MTTQIRTDKLTEFDIISLVSTIGHFLPSQIYSFINSSIVTTLEVETHTHILHFPLCAILTSVNAIYTEKSVLEYIEINARV
jgi:hypothetical protein